MDESKLKVNLKRFVIIVGLGNKKTIQYHIVLKNIENNDR